VAPLEGLTAIAASEKIHEQPTLDIVFAVDPGTLRFDCRAVSAGVWVTGSWAGPPAKSTA